MSEYRRFVSYIYAYNQGKKDKNVGFAKVEVRGGTLKVNIQLGGLKKESEGLDVYGFMRKREKLYGIWLGEMTAEAQTLFHYEGNPENLQESGYSLNELSGLWIKGNRGENYITVWDDDPIERMELEVEVRVLVEPEMEEAAQDEEAVEAEEATKAAENVEAAEAIKAAEGMEVKESTKAAESMEAEEATKSAESVEAAEAIKAAESMEAEEATKAAESMEAEEATKAAESIQIVETMQAAEIVSEQEWGTQPGTVLNGVRAKENEKLKELLGNGPRRQPFAAGEVKECIQITPRELSVFQEKGWNARKNNFVLQGYYQFRHLLFGCLTDGTYFLGVPGFFNLRERQRATAFGFPVFKESKEQHWNGRFGYWCRPLE